ncbi:hypothetical protein J1N35_028492 [Gossypium stocksii]|uniref:PPM-type phosphatase domain-containing protein n=1 Tax=Gossypium stocksii TaxID=47602 RepID=A0A9D3ZSM9_9ROSI|nr:hypothetical protein J1N35_028492 [Gossypium stocksii]
MGPHPWVIIGNFNAILSSFEKSGGRCKGKRCPFFGNTAWVQQFPNSLITHLPKIKSDHRPLLLSLNPALSLPRGRPFRFLAGWAEHPNFGNFVEEHWGFSGDMSISLNTLSRDLKDWNNRVYGYISSRKRLLLNELTRFQKIIDFTGSNRLAQFFHAHTVHRKKNSCITAIRNGFGDWIYDPEDIEVEANNFFQNLYGELPGPMGCLPPSSFPRLSQDDISLLEKQVTNEEIKGALFDMSPLKAPGSDGFHTLFFQKQWNTVGVAVCNWVRSIFNGANIDADLNNALIVLIPKVDTPEEFGHYHPISLCSVLYKLVMKVIANRFKVIFPKIIGLEQAGFIVGRNIIDNIIIAQEVIHSMKCSAKRKWMTIKIDLEKAYDRVHWDFIKASLQAAARGIQQGCPLSPYLFVLCMDWLGQAVHSAISEGKWSPIRLSRSGPPISHLFFADDLDILSKADMKHCVDTMMVNSISSSFGFQVVQNLVRYLGVSLFHKRVTNSTMQFVFEKVRGKLQSWDAKRLSIAGRITLAQSVLLSIPSYFMQSMMIPRKVCNEIESLDISVVPKKGTSWAGLFGILIWRLWKNHNLFIFQALKLAPRRGHDHVIILSDILDVVRVIQRSFASKSNSALVQRIQNILSQENFWCLRYIPREQNAVSDYLANEALSSREKVQEKIGLNPSNNAESGQGKTIDLGKWGLAEVTAILINCQKLVIPNVGYSRTVISKNGVAKQLSVDHEPASERESIENRGGFVSNFPGDVVRVGRQLAVVRAFGDKSLKKHLTSEPDVSIETIGDDTEY